MGPHLSRSHPTPCRGFYHVPHPTLRTPLWKWGVMRPPKLLPSPTAKFCCLEDGFWGASCCTAGERGPHLPSPASPVLLSRLVCPGCLCVSLWNSEPPFLPTVPPNQVLQFPVPLRASLIPPRLPGTGASWFKAIGELCLPTCPSLPPWFLQLSCLLFPPPLRFVPTSHGFPTFLPSFLSTWLLCCDIYFCIISFFLW